MSVFEYAHYNDRKATRDNPYEDACIYCQGTLQSAWGEAEDEQLQAIHQRTTKIYKKTCGLDERYFKLNLETKEEELWMNFCPQCGWWRILKNVSVFSESQLWDIFLGLTASLKYFDLNDLNQPIEEVGKFLTAKYESRFSVNPKLFENLVADVYGSIGYDVYVTGYSDDGGIDVVLGDGKTEIGVQVKRYKRKIEAEHIRAFAGALILANFRKGIFVTTSSYRAGAVAASKFFTEKTLPIELIDADKFYDALKISMKPRINVYEIMENLKYGSTTLFDYNFEIHRNSL